LHFFYTFLQKSIDRLKEMMTTLITIPLLFALANGFSATFRTGYQLSITFAGKRTSIWSALEDEDAQDLLKLSANSLNQNGKIPVLLPETKFPNKDDLYPSEDLMQLWNLHQDLSISQSPATPLQTNEPDLVRLHETVKSSMLIDCSANQLTSFLNVSISEISPNESWLNQSTRDRIGKIKAIATDVDGTLLSSDQTLHPRTQKAIQEAIYRTFSPFDTLQWFFPATGKSRAGALNSVGPEIARLFKRVPGVFLQGLYCVDAQGNVVFEQKLSKLQVEAAEGLARELGVSIIAYDGDMLVTTELTDVVKTLSEQYGEPKPKLLSTSIAEYKNKVNKILLLDFDAKWLRDEVRPKLEALAKISEATVTQAVPTMLEWLPPNASKANGVKKLCEKLGIDPANELLAIGDAENDVGMLQLASIGVAVGNACPIACEAADFVMTETNDEGGAGAAMEVFGLGFYSSL
jgi:Cof subfamily protein (haloacid dehalogenase superfamily)